MQAEFVQTGYKGGDLFDQNQLFKVFQAVSYGYICWLTESKADFG